MRRESVYVCSYDDGASELVAHVRAWDGEEAAELFAHEMELESEGGEVPIAEIRVRASHGREAGATSGP